MKWSMLSSGRSSSNKGAAEQGEMSFLEHLEDLRWALIRGLSAIVIAAIACSFFSKWIIDVILLGPTRPDFLTYQLLGWDVEQLVLQNRTITGQFFADIGTILAVGIVLGSPVFIYSLWRFIEPGLYPHERTGFRYAAFAATSFFIFGILFGYLVITPVALQFFASWRISDLIINEFDITKYFSMITFWAFGTGILFEVPVIIYALGRAGIVTYQALQAGRRYALLITLILGAVFTPPDPISQILVAIPLYSLYEVSIISVRRFQRKQARRAAAMAA